MTIAFINGKYTDQLFISPYDLGFLRGFGVFESFRTYDKAPLFLGLRLERLRNSAKEITIEIPYTDEQIEEIILRLIEENGFSESNIRLIVTKGIAHDGSNPEGMSSFYALATPFTPFPDSYYQRGIKVVTTNYTRFMPHIKTLNYLPGLLALEEAKTTGASEVLFCTDSGEILEGSTSNFFGIKGDKLITPSSQILYGITRQIILAATTDHFELELRPIHLEEIVELDEAFITSSLREVVPVVEIDGYTIGEGKAGPKTEIILDLFRSALFQLSLN